VSTRNKYEPARGVCALEWHVGFPSEDNQYGSIIVERWTNTMSWGLSQEFTPTVTVKAELIFLRWHRWEKTWVDEDGAGFDGRARNVVRRWARLGVRFAHTTVTVDKWGPL